MLPVTSSLERKEARERSPNNGNRKKTAWGVDFGLYLQANVYMLSLGTAAQQELPAIFQF